MKLENIKMMIAIFFVGVVLGWALPGLIHYKSTTQNFNQKNGEQAIQNSFKNNVESLKNKKDTDFDKAFIETMISKNQELVIIYQLANKNTQNQKIKDLAKNNIEKITEEIKTLNNWRVNGIQ